MSHFKVPAVSFAVIENNKISWVDAIGYVNSEHTKKVNSSTLFQAGSMSKSIAAMTALQLVEQGKLSLDFPVSPMLKGWKIKKTAQFKDTTVTLRQLLSMTSGLDVGGFYGYEPGKPLPTLIKTLEGEKPANNSPVQLIAQPGARYDYSGGGYEVIQLLVDSVTKIPFKDDVKKLVLAPLTMKDSFYSQPLSDQLAKNAADATDSKGKNFSYRWRVTPEYAAAGLWSTPTDLAKFVLSVMKSYQGTSNNILTKKMAQQTLSQQKNTQYGLGFVVEGKGKSLRFMKLGQNSGYQGWLVGFPNSGQGAIVMTNSDNGRELAQSLIYAIAKAYHWPTNGRLQDAWMIN